MNSSVIGAYDGLRTVGDRSTARSSGWTNLKVIGRAGIGVDNVVCGATARDRRDEHAVWQSITTPEHAIAMIFALRVSCGANASTTLANGKNRRFMGRSHRQTLASSAAGGNIGSIVADRALGFKMK